MTLAERRIMELSQKPECMDLALHNECGDDYPYQVSLNDMAFLLDEIMRFLQETNLTVEEIVQLEQQYSERYDSKVAQKETNEITW